MSSEEAKKEQRTKRKYFGVVTTIFNLQKAIFNLKVSWLCESVCVCGTRWHENGPKINFDAVNNRYNMLLNKLF